MVISCTTFQRITNLEKQTEEYKNQMNDLQITLEGKCTTTSSDLLGQPQDRPTENVLSLDDEDKEITNEFRRVISHEEMKGADDFYGK